MLNQNTFYCKKSFSKSLERIFTWQFSRCLISWMFANSVWRQEVKFGRQTLAHTSRSDTRSNCQIVMAVVCLSKKGKTLAAAVGINAISSATTTTNTTNTTDAPGCAAVDDHDVTVGGYARVWKATAATETASIALLYHKYTHTHARTRLKGLIKQNKMVENVVEPMNAKECPFVQKKSVLRAWSPINKIIFWQTTLSIVFQHWQPDVIALCTPFFAKQHPTRPPPPPSSLHSRLQMLLFAFIHQVLGPEHTSRPRIFCSSFPFFEFFQNIGLCLPNTTTTNSFPISFRSLSSRAHTRLWIFAIFSI